MERCQVALISSTNKSTSQKEYCAGSNFACSAKNNSNAKFYCSAAAPTKRRYPTRHRVGKATVNARTAFISSSPSPPSPFLSPKSSLVLSRTSPRRQNNRCHSSWRKTQLKWTTLRCITSTGKHNAHLLRGQLELTCDSYNHHGTLYKFRLNSHGILTAVSFSQEYTRKCWCVPTPPGAHSSRSRIQSTNIPAPFFRRMKSGPSRTEMPSTKIDTSSRIR